MTRKEYLKAWAKANPEKVKAAQKKWREANKEFNIGRQRPYQLKLKYNMVQADYDTLLKQQNYKCAICSTDKPTGKWKVFAVDHDHETNNVRGLLCNECNRGIGLLKDNPELLMKAASYLEKHKKKTKEERENK